MYVDYILYIEDLPSECIADCSASGSVDDAVDYWREELDFTVNPDRARDCLRGYGAWDDDELQDDDANARRVLWLACCNFSEYRFGGENAGSEFFVLEA